MEESMALFLVRLMLARIFVRLTRLLRFRLVLLLVVEEARGE
jgi:hypothetical protein